MCKGVCVSEMDKVMNISSRKVGRGNGSMSVERDVCGIDGRGREVLF